MAGLSSAGSQLVPLSRRVALPGRPTPRENSHICVPLKEASQSCLEAPQITRRSPTLKASSWSTGAVLDPALIGLDGDGSVVQPRAARPKTPPVMPYVWTPAGPSDLMNTFLRNRIIFVGSTINAPTAQRVISQLITLASISEEEDIKMYINCPGGSTYSVLAIYDCMAWVKPDISTVGFGMCASQGAFLLAAGTKGKRMAMPNTRIMIHQPQGGCGGTSEDVRRQVNEVMASRDKLDKMFSVFTGQPLELIQKYTERDRFFSAAEAAEFGLIDSVLETEY